MSKERLVELLLQTETFTADIAGYVRQQAEYKADYLLANGVIVPPCKVGDMVYRVSFVHKNVIPLKVEGFVCNLSSWKVHCTHLIPSWVGNKKEHLYISFSSFGKSVFPTIEEAEAKLKGDKIAIQ